MAERVRYAAIGSIAMLLVSCAGTENVTRSSVEPTTVPPELTPSPSRAPTASPSPSAAETRYVAIGASDTVGVGASDPAKGSWPALLAARMPAANYTNLGVSGSLAAEARTQQVPAAIAARPTLVTIWLAVNDLNANVAPDDYATSLRGIVDALVNATPATLFVGTVPDLRAVPSYASVDPAALLATVQGYNARISSLERAYPTRVVVVDLFTGSAALMTSGTVATDGFHPSDAGYALVAERFAAAMRAKGVALR